MCGDQREGIEVHSSVSVSVAYTNSQVVNLLNLSWTDIMIRLDFSFVISILTCL